MALLLVMGGERLAAHLLRRVLQVAWGGSACGIDMHMHVCQPQFWGCLALSMRSAAWASTEAAYAS